MQHKNYYLLLGIKQSSTAKELKTAYRTLAKKYHPDKTANNKASDELFKEIQNAYSVLSNSALRAKYDVTHVYFTSHISTKNYTTYNGNAYGYAQENENSKVKSSTNSKQKQETNELSEWYFALISIVLAALLVYFIIGN